MKCFQFGKLLALTLLTSCHAAAISTSIPSATPDITSIPQAAETSTPVIIPFATVTKPINIPLCADNRRIAFSAQFPPGRMADIHIMCADGSGLTNLTNHPANDIHPVWSPDGKHIAFESDRDGFMQIYRMRPDGSDVIQLTQGPDHHAIGVNFGAFFDPWSPSGDNLIFSKKNPGAEKWMLYVMDIYGENIHPFASAEGQYGSPSWSPDGQHISYAALEPHGDQYKSQIYIIDKDGDNRTTVTALLPKDEDPIFWKTYWARDGKTLFFIAQRTRHQDDNGKHTVYEASLDGKELIERMTSKIPIYSWQEETSILLDTSGKKISWLRSDGTSSTLNLIESCQTPELDDYGVIHAGSLDGHLFMGARCPNGDGWFYWSNPNGTSIKPLPSLEISLIENYISNIVWSPDNSYIALNISFPDKTNLYLWNMNFSSNDPSVQPLELTVGGPSFRSGLAWQPVFQVFPSPQPTLTLLK